MIRRNKYFPERSCDKMRTKDAAMLLLFVARPDTQDGVTPRRNCENQSSPSWSTRADESDADPTTAVLALSITLHFCSPPFIFPFNSRLTGMNKYFH